MNHSMKWSTTRFSLRWNRKSILVKNLPDCRMLNWKNLLIQEGSACVTNLLSVKEIVFGSYRSSNQTAQDKIYGVFHHEMSYQV